MTDETKDIVALVLLLLAIPACIVVTIASTRIRDAAFFLMIAATVVSDRLDVNFFSHFWYRGTTRGVEFSFVDVLALGVLAGSTLSPPSGRHRFYWPASFGWMLLFFVYAGILVLCIEPRIYGLLELSKMLRGLLFFLSTAMYVRRERELAIFVLALCCAVCLEGGWAFKQRVLGSIDRAPGTLDHANSLSMYMCLVSPVFVAAATSTLPKLLRAFSILAIAAAAVGILLTVSRAGVPIFALVMLGATAVCVSWRITPGGAGAGPEPDPSGRRSRGTGGAGAVEP